ncbi:MULTISPECIES: class I SAM-dependent methyltransferase [Psychrobacter]|uniref:class I SAM-dependent methyltransferase n=1 Tax=Psychrobacter TaxID=497 RepID=UPI003FD2A42D
MKQDEISLIGKSENTSDDINKLNQNIIKSQNLIYSQLESLSWLQRRLLPKTQLPALRGWASSPDVLLYLHTHIMQTKPKVVVEFGSGASTLVIADALSQNGEGMLFSIEHSDGYGAQTLFQLEQNCLQNWVDLRIGGLVLWEEEHLNPEEASKPSLWYPISLLQDIENVDLIWVDGPPGNTCPYSRYPALPALSNQLSENAEVWMDDTIRQVEKDICEDWAQKYGFDLEYITLEKGLGRLTRPI